VVSIPACHAGDPGSIPGLGVLLFFFCCCFFVGASCELPPPGSTQLEAVAD
jgi:hypothetical protein